MGINPNSTHHADIRDRVSTCRHGGRDACAGPRPHPVCGNFGDRQKAFAIVIIGGFGNVEGTILAGLIVGLIESYTTQFLDPGLI